MNQVKVVYDYVVEGGELSIHEMYITSHETLCELIDSYPWQSALTLFEQFGVGGGFHFSIGDDHTYACFQYVPIDINSGVLDLDIVLKSGLLNFFGRKALSKHFDVVSIPDMKMQVKELFQYSLSDLYKKHHD
ncbi:hypothetical protein [Aeromonas hydrophila]|uniref:hypothetical protein n=1 Tax=Aeromonas hydrophila TaxID=644 RepID=UPI002B47051A|nr:hypothetical protein [Aeromonas hydrophila]